MKKINLKKITSISTVIYLLVLNATQYNVFAFTIGTIWLIALIFLNFRMEKE